MGFLKIGHHTQAGYEGMLKIADKVGGVKKIQRHADVIYGWSLSDRTANLLKEHFPYDSVKQALADFIMLLSICYKIMTSR